MESALHDYFDAKPADRELTVRRLDRVSREVTTLHRDVDLLSHAFGVFIQVWFAHTPRIPDQAKDGVEETARRRFRQFLDHVTDQFAAGNPFARAAGVESEPDTDVQETSEGGTSDDRSDI